MAFAAGLYCFSSAKTVWAPIKSIILAKTLGKDTLAGASKVSRIKIHRIVLYSSLTLTVVPAKHKNKLKYYYMYLLQK